MDPDEFDDDKNHTFDGIFIHSLKEGIKISRFLSFQTTLKERNKTTISTLSSIPFIILAIFLGTRTIEVFISHSFVHYTISGLLYMW